MIRATLPSSRPKSIDYGAFRYGKSTLLRLLIGELPLASGQYYLGNVQITAATRTQLSHLFGLIKQTPFMFDDTIRFNLTLGGHFSQTALDKAVADAGLMALIAQKGWDYQVGEEGHHLSGGQIQRLEIARALFAAAPDFVSRRGHFCVG